MVIWLTLQKGSLRVHWQMVMDGEGERRVGGREGKRWKRAESGIETSRTNCLCAPLVSDDTAASQRASVLSFRARQHSGFPEKAMHTTHAVFRQM